MAALKLEDVRLPRNARRDPALPVFKKLAAGQVHPLRAHCFAGMRGAQLTSGVKELPPDSVTYVYAFEKLESAAKTRHTKSREYRFLKPFAEGLLEAGVSLTCCLGASSY